MNPYAGDKAAMITLKVLEKLSALCVRCIFEIAVARGNVMLILGAFGYRAFRNPPQIITKLFNAVMRDYINYFDTIEYALYNTEHEVSNYDAFKKKSMSRNQSVITLYSYGTIFYFLRSMKSGKVCG